MVFLTCTIVWPTFRLTLRAKIGAQFTRSVGKYLHALNPDVIQQERLLDVNPVEGYMEDLQ
jgi:hypothetical protein